MGGDWGTQSLRWGGTALAYSNISRTTVIGYVAKYEAIKKSCPGGILGGEIEVFGQKG